MLKNILLKQNISPILSAIIVSFFAVFILNVVLAWTGPTAVPPNNNVSAPVNVGLTPQNKNGALGVGAFTSFGDAYFAENVGIGTANPAYKLDIQGGNMNVSGSLYEAGTVISLKYATVNGSNANGTWGINITGSAGSASSANTAGYANSAGSASTAGYANSAGSAGSVGPFNSNGTTNGTIYGCWCTASNGTYPFTMPWSNNETSCRNACALSGYPCGAFFNIDTNTGHGSQVGWGCVSNGSW